MNVSGPLQGVPILRYVYRGGKLVINYILFLVDPELQVSIRKITSELSTATIGLVYVGYCKVWPRKQEDTAFLGKVIGGRH